MESTTHRHQLNLRLEPDVLNYLADRAQAHGMRSAATYAAEVLRHAATHQIPITPMERTYAQSLLAAEEATPYGEASSAIRRSRIKKKG